MPADRLPARLRVLRSLERWPHRYQRIRRGTMALTLAVLYAVPLLGLARFDLWAGRHRILGHATNPVYGFAGMLGAIVAFYFVTFVINAAFGRLFCGFGCPVGEVHRLGDGVELAARSGEGRLRAEARAVGFALAIAGALFLWLADPRVFVEGRPRAVILAAASLAGITALVYLHGRFVRWAFCRKACPIGVYYSAVQTAHAFGIHFDKDRGTCTDCDNCAQVCPVGLTPRALDTIVTGIGGIALDDFPQQNHCLTCGDCVRACELTFRKKGQDLVPLRLSLGARGSARQAELPPEPPGGRRARDAKAAEAAVISSGSARA